MKFIRTVFGIHSDTSVLGSYTESPGIAEKSNIEMGKEFDPLLK